MTMPDLENAIKGLECCTSPSPSYCRQCPYKGKPDDYPHCVHDRLQPDALALLKAQEPITGETSDGYHTFNELYHHRAVLFSVIVANYPERAWKSKKHHDGTMYDGMFIVGIETPSGQATYHYDINPYWDMFKCQELEYAPEWDGHTPAQAIERIGRLAGLKAQAANSACTKERCPVNASAISDDCNIETCPWRTEALIPRPSMSGLWYECPACGRHLTKDLDNYCARCGRRVKWE